MTDVKDKPSRWRFRAWQMDPGVMYGPEANDSRGMYALGIYRNCCIDSIEIYSGESSGCLSPQDFILMQSTGLADENGEDVFEGDVVDFIPADRPNSNVLTGDVVWGGDMWCVKVGDKLHSHLGDIGYIVVTGNVYEGPYCVEDV